MNISQTFNEFISNLEVNNQNNIEYRFSRITKRLNTDFHSIDSDTENGTYIGSYGRNTAISGISDLDMIFRLPDETFNQYDKRTGNKQSQLLQDVKLSIQKTYPQSIVRGDGQVVVIEFTKDYIEVCPAFLENDGSFTYPDSNNGGRWKKTNPIPEANEINEYNQNCNNNLVNLCRIVRAWKNKTGVKINGLLIDTFVYYFFKLDSKYENYNLGQYDILVKDFFNFLKGLDDSRKYWFAPGSNQKVYKKKSNFKSKAKKAHKIVEEAIANNDKDDVYEIWRKVFGKAFPYPQHIQESSGNYTDKEEFIEDSYPLNITNRLRINCEVSQAGFRTELLRNMLFLSKNKSLRFFIEETDVSEPYNVLWKIKNEGIIAKEKNMHRGQIITSNHRQFDRKESSNFEGPHYAECYIIKNNYCVARDRIDVPISNN